MNARTLPQGSPQSKSFAGIPEDIFNDILACAEELEAQATESLRVYEGYAKYERRAKDDLKIAQRVKDWVRTARIQQASMEEPHA